MGDREGAGVLSPGRERGTNDKAFIPGQGGRVSGSFGSYPWLIGRPSFAWPRLLLSAFLILTRARTGVRTNMH